MFRNITIVSVLLASIFFLQNTTLCARKKNPIKLSILICTLEERKETYERLKKELVRQIKENKLEDKIEILAECDNRQKTIGEKRNCLLDRARGEYLCYFDDDDRPHPQYIKTIYEKLQKNPDCVCITAIMTRNGKDPKPLIHRLKYKSWYVKNDIYYRPPNHLTAIRSSIAKLFRFPPKNSGEDVEWSMAIARSGLLKTQEVIKEPFYFYDYISDK